ncbi:hypothetical protein [Rhizobium sp. P40RR-XXII]|uniref:hypothetical protein n=1 Tax=Rhizobium sp. P40RR-XXII TaxID=2726739 RepID=UPI001FEF41C6|nr:hypothetical protein [Rhizobium sp. P40RR-XXII]
MPRRAPTGSDCQMLAEAVLQWYHFYEVPPDDEASRALVGAALEFFHDGYHTTEDIAVMLIGTYIGIWPTKFNAPTSAAIH